MLPRFQIPISILAMFLTAMLAGCGSDSSEVDDGLQVQDLVVGRGAEVAPGDFIKIHYRCLPMKDGEQSGPLDDSRDRGRPFVYQVGADRVPVGWDRGVTGMQVGGQRRIAVPPELGYGAEKVGRIRGGSTLVLEVELLALPRVSREILSDGEGRLVAVGDEVAIEYRAWLAPDGKAGPLFDSSEARGEPSRFEVGRGVVLPAWDQALPGLRRGARARLVVPSDLGFGPRGLVVGDSLIVPADTDLIYEVTVLDVVPAG